MPDLARIVVRRPPGGARDLLRKYRIEIDGARAGTVARGGAAEFSVPAGLHRVRATIDWAGSPTLLVDLAPGQAADLRVCPGGSAVRVDQLFSRTGYLRLSAADGVDAEEVAAAVPKPPRAAMLGLPLGFVGIFLVACGTSDLLHRSHPYDWAAILAGIALYVVPLVLSRRAHRRRSEAGR